MSILKLALGRENAISGTITSIELDETGKFGPQYKITMGEDLLWLSKDAVDRQTARIELTPDELVGKQVTWWKKPMDNDPTKTKGFLNLDLGTWGTPVGSGLMASALADDQVGRGLRNAGVPVARASNFDVVVDKYVECLGRAHAIVSDYNVTFAVDPDGGVLMDKTLPSSVVTSVAATLLIERHKAGV